MLHEPHFYNLNSINTGIAIVKFVCAIRKEKNTDGKPGHIVYSNIKFNIVNKKYSNRTLTSFLGTYCNVNVAKPRPDHLKSP